jgi:hypothetical protein
MINMRNFVVAKLSSTRRTSNVCAMTIGTTPHRNQTLKEKIALLPFDFLHFSSGIVLVQSWKSPSSSMSLGGSLFEHGFSFIHWIL